MTPFENLITELGKIMELPLKPDEHQACLLNFSNLGVRVQIDLDTHADKIVMGIQLGSLNAGPYREQILKQAMRVNGISTFPRGVLAYSEKNDILVLFQFFPLLSIDGEKLHNFILLFVEHASIWIEAIKVSAIPPLEEDMKKGPSSMFGLH